MKVLMIVSWYSSYNAEKISAGIFHYEQAMNLQKYCSTALYYPYDTNLEYGYREGIEHKLLVYRRNYKKNKVLYYLQCIKDFYKIKREYKPDILHGHVASGAGILTTILGKLFHIPVVITEHNPIELSSLDHFSMRKIVGWVYHNSYANICVSKDLRERLNNIYPKEEFQVIYNGIIDPATIELDEENYAKSGYINCAIVAAFYDKNIKGYQYLLPAVAELVKKNYNIMLHICGGGDYLEYYKEMARELSITDYCIFYGQCDRKKVYSIVRQMDFNISASIFECSGVSVQEAMLLGKPLVVTKSGGANSLVTEDTAIVVERESVEALEAGMEEMINCLSKFDENQVKEYAYRQFEISNISKQYMSLYKNILKKDA